jgi:hypothetical protein
MANWHTTRNLSAFCLFIEFNQFTLEISSVMKTQPERKQIVSAPQQCLRGLSYNALISIPFLQKLMFKNSIL